MLGKMQIKKGLALTLNDGAYEEGEKAAGRFLSPEERFHVDRIVPFHPL